MGKVEEQPPERGAETGAPPCGGVGAVVRRVVGWFSFRCVLVLALSFCVALSAVFWLPPFRDFGSGSRGGESGELDTLIRASFNLQMRVELVEDQKERLEYEIFEEIGAPYTKISIISVLPFASPNWTNVVFGVLPDSNDDIIPVWALSVLRSSFIGLVLLDYNLTLTPSVFGKPTSFEILKFPGGVTVPGQASLLPKLNEILFNFTLNNSISQIEKNLYQLKDGLKYGLELRPNENVYVRMTNLEGSTVSPPVIVQSSVFSDMGNNILLPQRLKQLAEALAGYHDKNLGLDHTVFGKVKQVQLSSYLEHSLGSSPSPSPSPYQVPTPTPGPAPCDHSHLVPSISPSPSVFPSVPFPPDGVYAPLISPIPQVQPPEYGLGYSSPSTSPAPSKSVDAEPPECGPDYSFPSTSPAPSISVNARPPLSSPNYAPMLPPNVAPAVSPTHSTIFPPVTSRKAFPSPQGQPKHSIQGGPSLPPTASVTALGPEPHNEVGLERSPSVAPSPITSAASTTHHMLKIWLKGIVIFYLLSCYH